MPYAFNLGFGHANESKVSNYIMCLSARVNDVIRYSCLPYRYAKMFEIYRLLTIMLIFWFKTVLFFIQRFVIL